MRKPIEKTIDKKSIPTDRIVSNMIEKGPKPNTSSKSKALYLLEGNLCLPALHTFVATN